MKTAIFDMDGTLIDSMWIWVDIDKTYLTAHNVPLTKEVYEKVASLTFIEATHYFKELTKTTKTPEEIAIELLDMARDRYRTQVEMKPFAIDYLDKLQKDGVKMGIATASPREFAEIILERFGLKPYFPVVLTSSEVEKGKRDPDMYHQVREMLGGEIATTCVFEDALHAAETAAKAGYTVIGIADQNGRHSPETFAEVCHQTIDSWAELL